MQKTCPIKFAGDSECTREQYACDVDCAWLTPGGECAVLYIAHMLGNLQDIARDYSKKLI